MAGTHNDPFNNLNLPTPFPDALQEFKVETSSLPARYGHHAAAAVNVVTKSAPTPSTAPRSISSATTDSTRELFRAEKDSLRRQQFGGTLGGPMIQNRLFFFGGYQGKVEKTDPPTTRELCPDGGDAGGRLHRVCVTGVQRPTGGPRRPPFCR